MTAQNNYNTAVSGIKTLPSKIKNLKKKIKKAGGSTTVYKSTSINRIQAVMPEIIQET